MTKVLWRSKGQGNLTHPVFAATKPGKCVSIDHMQSTELGFYGQLKRTLTKKRYRNATILLTIIPTSKLYGYGYGYGYLG